MNTPDIDYYQYLQSEEWQKKAFDAKKRASFRCQICYLHEDQTILDAHHRTYDRLGKEHPEDITVLCRDCHELFTRYDRIAKHGLREQIGIRTTKTLYEIFSNSINEQGQKIPITTGFKDVDKILGSIEGSDLITIASRSGMGKTAFISNVALHTTSKQGRAVTVFSLQLSSEQFIHRLLAGESQIDYQRIRIGNILANELPVFQETIENVVGLPLTINDTPAITPEQLRIHCYRQFDEQALDLIIIDGFEFMKLEKSIWNRNQKLNEIARSLKGLARELNIPVILTTQLPSEVEKRQDKRPLLIDLQDNGELDQVSDIVIFIYRDEYYNPDSPTGPNIAEIRISKNHNGYTSTADLYWDRRLAVFRNLQRQEINLGP